MPAARQETQQAVARATLKKTQREKPACVLLELVERSFPQARRIKKRPKMQVSMPIHKMNLHRRQKRTLAILFHWIVGSEKSRARDDRVQYAHRNQPPNEPPALRHLVPAIVRILGSAQ